MHRCGFRLLALQIFLRDDVDEEVENLRAFYASCDVALLKCAAFGFFGVVPCAVRKLYDEYFARLCEQYWRLRRDHLG